MTAPAPQEGKVKSVLSGDTLILQNKSKQERTLSLAFINAPRLQQDEPRSFESRDFIRKLCVGKVVHFKVLLLIPTEDRWWVARVWNSHAGWWPAAP